MRFELYAGGWVDDLPPLYPGTPMLMSSVHPRTKKYVGDRLAAAAWAVAYGHNEKPATGPVLAGCRLEGNKLILSYNTSLLKDDTVRLIIGAISFERISLWNVIILPWLTCRFSSRGTTKRTAHQVIQCNIDTSVALY